MRGFGPHNELVRVQFGLRSRPLSALFLATRECPNRADIHSDSGVRGRVSRRCLSHRRSWPFPTALFLLVLLPVACERSLTGTSERASALWVRPASAALIVNQQIQLSATVRNEAGTALPGPAIAWSSNDAAVASVTGVGLVTALATGAATVTASTGDLTGSSTITVRSSSNTVDLTVTRLDGGTGQVLVSNGIPLLPGQLRATDLADVRLTVEGEEQSICIEALHGTHPDGSLRAILLQFVYELSAGNPVVGQLSLEAGRTTGDRTKVTPPGAPQAVALPSSPDYLVSTEMGGALLTFAGTPSTPSFVTDHSSDYKTFDDEKWPSPGAAYDGRGAMANYEHILTHYQEWMRTGDIVMWQRATAMAMDYRTRKVEPENLWVGEWYMQSTGLRLHYWLTGDDRSRLAVGKLAEQGAAATRAGFPEPSQWMGGVGGNDRLRGRAMMAAIDAWLIDAPTGIYYTGRDLVDRNLDWVLSTQRPNGMFGGYDYAHPNVPPAPGGYECCTSQKNFMVGVLLTAMVWHYELVEPDARIPAAIGRAVDYLWNNEWVASAQGFKYISDGYVGSEGGQEPEPGLNVLLLPGFAWYYYHTGNPAYRDRADQVLSGVRRNRPNWHTFHKQFDQAYAFVFNCFVWGQ